MGYGALERIPSDAKQHPPPLMSRLRKGTLTVAPYDFQEP